MGIGKLDKKYYILREEFFISRQHKAVPDDEFTAFLLQHSGLYYDLIIHCKQGSSCELHCPGAVWEMTEILNWITVSFPISTLPQGRHQALPLHCPLPKMILFMSWAMLHCLSTQNQVSKEVGDLRRNSLSSKSMYMLHMFFVSHLYSGYGIARYVYSIEMVCTCLKC